MPIASTALDILQQEGYRPQSGPGDMLTFRYYGQAAAVRVQPLGSGAIVELECTLPRPAPAPGDAAAFEQRHALARIGSVQGQAQLRVQTMLSAADAAAQFQMLLHLLDTYAAAYVFTDLPEWAGPESAEPALATSVGDVEGAPQVQVMEAPPLQPEVTPRLQAQEAPQSAAPSSADAPVGWENVWGLLNGRFHPLARALAALQVPVPDEVQMDMMHGRQVKGTAIMMWGSPPDAVVVCEQGQTVPYGYRGGTWLRHQTVEQVAQETRAYLQAVGRA